MAMAYRIGWVVFCGVAGLAGALGAADWSLSVLVLLFAVAGATGGMIALVVLNPDETTRRPREVWTIVAKCTVVSGAATIVLGGLGSLAGAWTTLWVGLVAIGGAPSVVPHWIGWFREPPAAVRPTPKPRSRRKPMSRGAGVTVTPEHVEDLTELSDEALCLAWRASFAGLQRAAAAPSDQLRVVEERRAYLDELERRHPDGVAAWLASNPRAAGDPAKFVRGDSAHGQHPIDWNGLIP
ncbi:hypothetical protein [Kribbella sp.]|uniref:hypothetical protein n=1 Tax=Kribbella sp. TaxID=1871183 RepID=UPI002D312FEE|nr:hypothetical protein [Kribbella sp.]HZX03243.1 hypothetical protein [Kribbella sp.]